MSTDQKETYKRWYEKHKEELAERRKKRYQTDPVYRAKAKANRKAQAAKERATRTPLPEDYVFNMTQLAERLGVSEWCLRDWREKQYYPTPYQHSRALYFTMNHMALLTVFRDFMATPHTTEERDDKVSWVHANW